MKSSLLRGVFGTAGLNAAGLALNILMGIFLARILGKSDFGYYSFVISTMTILSLPTMAGLPMLLVREIARQQSLSQFGKINGLLATCNRFAVIYSLLAAMTSGVVCWAMIQLQPTDFRVFLYSLALIPLMGLGGLFAAKLRGFRFTVLGQIPEQLIRPVTLIFLLGVTYLSSGKVSNEKTMLFTVTAYGAALATGLLLLKKVIPGEVKSSKPVFAFREWSTSLLPLTCFAGLKTADAQLTSLLVGSLGTMDDVALLRIATQGALLVSFGLIAVNLVIAPHIAELFAKNQIEKLQALITRCTQGVFIVSIPIACVFIFAGKPLISIVFGEEYESAAIPLSILTVGQLFNVASGAVVLVLNMTGHERQTLFGIVVAILVKLVLAVLLIPTFGVVGAAIAAAVAEATWNLVLLRATYITTGINTFVIA